MINSYKEQGKNVTIRGKSIILTRKQKTEKKKKSSKHMAQNWFNRKDIYYALSHNERDVNSKHILIYLMAKLGVR